MILIDPLDESVHRLSSGVYQQALGRAAELRAGVLESSHALVQRGYHAQVHVVEDSTLIFVARHGDRVALHQRDGKFFLDGTEEISLSQLQSLLAERPLDFSPNVLLRPLVQDSLLPTLAYVAGPSELAYLGQAQSLYKALGRPQPVVFPRAAFTLIDSRTDRLMEKYKLSLEDVWQGDEHLSQKIAATGFAEGWSERFDQSERELDQLLNRLQGDIEKLDPTLARYPSTYQREDEVPDGAAARQADAGRARPLRFACPSRAGPVAIPPAPQGLAGTPRGRGVFPGSRRLRFA